MTARRTITLFALLLATPFAHAQVADMLRSVTGALRGAQSQDASSQQNKTGTLGVRGMDEATNTAAAPASGDYALMEKWAAKPADAQHAAAKKGLASRPASLKPR